MLRHLLFMLVVSAIILLCSSCSGAPGLPPATVSPVATGAELSSTSPPANLMDVIPSQYLHFFTAQGNAMMLNMDEIEKTFSTYAVIDGLHEPKEKAFKAADIISILDTLAQASLINPQKPMKTGFHWEMKIRNNVLDKSSGDQIILYMPDQTTITFGVADRLITKSYFSIDFEIPKDKGEQLDKLFATAYDQ